MKVNINIGLLITLILALLIGGWLAGRWNERMMIKNGKGKYSTQGGMEVATETPSVAA